MPFGPQTGLSEEWRKAPEPSGLRSTTPNDQSICAPGDRTQAVMKNTCATSHRSAKQPKTWSQNFNDLFDFQFWILRRSLRIRRHPTGHFGRFCLQVQSLCGHTPNRVRVRKVSRAVRRDCATESLALGMLRPCASNPTRCLAHLARSLATFLREMRLLPRFSADPTPAF
ncbi:MAG: hypothetical protein RL591_1781 [Planctomycetota bacterium]